ncbi:NAD(P)/FAD-dependent oxidoreductase [Synechococcus sp. Nb3U1]|uniref:NAD(P)/FAD-dependent oxidoreductase n=1 Tax=Synechococcus sp. Nb3U1 TaxID=1914529 RepID=UPI001F34A65A|nr:NAD(P)/FAD-dependent oxidoreductase [Synechococcus sp. Nb3U1]MCF2972024.1 NAD(P)/FAD-dependent oxidoreductase [Synechococcus sp. Nb3U1]
MSRICILGGGFGGLYTALELSRQPWPEPPQITLVDRQERFVFAPLLYELLTGEMEDWEVAPRFQNLLSPESVQFVQGSVTAIDPKARRVTLGEGQSLDYDGLVLALGGETPLDRVPGAAEYAFPFRTLADAQRLRTHLKHLEAREPAQPIRLAIAGAGASGVELACKLADRLGSRGQIRLIELGSHILSGFAESSRGAAQQALQERGIQVELRTQVLRIEAVDEKRKNDLALHVRRIDSEAMASDPVDAVLWTVGTQMSGVIRALDLPKTEQGRLQVFPTLQIPSFPTVFALGDVAAVVDADGQSVPATAQAAFQQASYCAWNLWAALTQERPLLPFRYWSLGEMLSLGVDTAVLSALGGFTLTGPLGYLARRAAYLVRMPTLEHQLKVGWNWISRPLWEGLLPR